MGKYVTADEVEEIVDRKVGVVIEHMDDKFDIVLSILDSFLHELRGMAKQADLIEVKNDVKTLHYALKETNQDQKALARRVTKLEKLSHSHA